MARRSIVAGLLSPRHRRSMPHILTSWGDEANSVHEPMPLQYVYNTSISTSFLRKEWSVEPRELCSTSFQPCFLRPFRCYSSAAAVDGAESTVSAAAPFAGEVAAAAAGSFPPVAALQYLIDGVHSFTGLDWWASIALTTLLIRTMTVPLLIKQRKAIAKLSMIRPDLQALGVEIQTSKDPQSIQEGVKKVKSLFKENGITPFTPFTGLLIQGPIFLSFYFAISNMAQKFASFKVGGAFWFTDLAAPDALYIFPVLTSLTFLATVEFNMEDGLEGNPVGKKMKDIFRVLALLSLPVTAFLPKAILCYWVSSNMFSLLYGFALKHPTVLKHLDIPVVTSEPGSSPKQPTVQHFDNAVVASEQAPTTEQQPGASLDVTDLLSTRCPGEFNLSKTKRKVPLSAAECQVMEQSGGSKAS